MTNMRDAIAKLNLDSIKPSSRLLSSLHGLDFEGGGELFILHGTELLEVSLYDTLVEDEVDEGLYLRLAVRGNFTVERDKDVSDFVVWIAEDGVVTIDELHYNVLEHRVDRQRAEKLFEALNLA